MPVLGLELLVVDVARDLEIAHTNEDEADHLAWGAQLGEQAGLGLAGIPFFELQVFFTFSNQRAGKPVACL